MARSSKYEITFAGQAGPAIRAEFDDCEVISAYGATTLRVALPDQAALSGLLQRIIGLRLELMQLLLIEPADDGTPVRVPPVTGSRPPSGKATV